MSVKAVNAAWLEGRVLTQYTDVQEAYLLYAHLCYSSARPIHRVLNVPLLYTFTGLKSPSRGRALVNGQISRYRNMRRLKQWNIVPALTWTNKINDTEWDSPLQQLTVGIGIDFFSWASL